MLLPPAGLRPAALGHPLQGQYRLRRLADDRRLPVSPMSRGGRLCRRAAQASRRRAPGKTNLDQFIAFNGTRFAP